MAYYLYQVTYTREAWAAQLQNPQNVADRTRASVEELGGSIVGVWYAFGESDLIGVVEMPDNVSMAALAMAFAAGGAVSAAKTTVLMSPRGWAGGDEQGGRLQLSTTHPATDPAARASALP